MSHLSEALELFAVAGRKADIGLNAFLPAPVEKQALLGRKTEMTFIPFAIFVNTQIGKQLARVFRLLAGDRDIVGSPGISRNVVFSPAGITSRIEIHLQQNKIGETALL